MNRTLITADLIHDGKNFLSADTVLELGADGTILAIHQDPALKQQAVHYEGTLLPAFVNVHCHLELSHMKGRIPRHTGLIPFLQRVATQRGDITEAAKSAARHAAYHELHAGGVIATGDIANSTDTLDIRRLQRMHIHTFVECIGFTETHAQQRFDYSVKIRQAFAAQERASGPMLLRQSIVPHAPYSVSTPLFRLIDTEDAGRSVVSIHNQESEEENHFYRDKTGTVNELLQGLGIDTGFFIPTGKTSLQSYLPLFTPTHPFVFVHNTCTTEADIRFARQYLPESYWCLCPNANLYIENALPDLPLLMREGAVLCIGTDSLASNDRLSILHELQTLKRHFPELAWETLYRWATYNGACALQMADTIGSLQPGLRPGIICLSGKEPTVSWVSHPGDPAG